MEMICQARSTSPAITMRIGFESEKWWKEKKKLFLQSRVSTSLLKLGKNGYIIYHVDESRLVSDEIDWNILRKQNFIVFPPSLVCECLSVVNFTISVSGWTMWDCEIVELEWEKLFVCDSIRVCVLKPDKLAFQNSNLCQSTFQSTS